MLLAGASPATDVGLQAGMDAPTPPQAPESAIDPPIAKKIAKVFVEHGHRRSDNYDWLRNEQDPDALNYLRAENAYAERRLARIKPLVDEIERELYQRAEGAGESPEFVDNGYVYQRRMIAGARFPMIVRHSLRPGALEEVVLDTESLAAGQSQYGLDDWVVSPDGKQVAFAVDFTGGRLHRIFVRDIATGSVTDTGIGDAASDLVFSADSGSLFYVRTEPGTVRSYQVWCRTIGAEHPRDRLVYEEADPTFEVGLSKTKSNRFILLTISQEHSTEVRYLSADRPYGRFRTIEFRRPGVIYEADQIGDRFYIRTNLNAPDFRLVSAPVRTPRAANWVDVVPGTPGRYLAQFELFDTFIAITEEHDAVQSVRVFRRGDGSEITVPRPAEIGVMETEFAQGSASRDASSTALQVRFSAPNRPISVYDFETRTGDLLLRKQSRAWNWLDPTLYEVRRVEARASDGEAIPVTLLYRRDLVRAGGNPVLINGYGAYGSSTLPEFSDAWLSLIDRGFIYAMAHVRGGREKGQRWYEHGRMLEKRNSFTDFIAATEELVAEDIADRHRIFAYGRSAGGLLVGAVVNLRPDLYAGVVAGVPFVDVVTTMADASLPLTTLEYEEWGDPRVKEQYDYMLSYSPYDNVAAKPYPAMYVTAALNDSQVGYHEPAKWVARLRATKTDKNDLLLVSRP